MISKCYNMHNFDKEMQSLHVFRIIPCIPLFKFVLPFDNSFLCVTRKCINQRNYQKKIKAKSVFNGHIGFMYICNVLIFFAINQTPNYGYKDNIINKH